MADYRKATTFSQSIEELKFLFLGGLSEVVLYTNPSAFRGYGNLF